MPHRKHTPGQCHRIQNLALYACALLLAGCIELDPEASQRMANDASVPRNMHTFDTMETLSPQLLYEALNHPSRRPADRAQDERRRADDVLEFFGVVPGMAVLDLYSGGGYYAELLSYVVGPQGRVVAHNNSATLNFAREENAARYTDGRLPNVEPLIAESSELELAPGSFDVVIMINAFHHLYVTDGTTISPQIDRERFLGKLLTVLKPGGTLGIVNHVTEPGVPPEESVARLQRIDQAIIVDDLVAAGFRFDDETDLLRNPADRRSVSVFDPAVRGRTDRVVLRFRKP